MNALHIALKDIQIFVKERGNLINAFLVPLIFILVVSTMTSGAATEDEEDAGLLTLPVVNLDADSEVSQAFVEALNAGGAVQVELYDQDEALTLLDNMEIGWVLTIPANSGQDIAAAHPVTLELLNHPNADETITQSLLSAINGVAQEMSLQAYLIAALQQTGDMQAAASPEQQAFTPERNVAQAQSQFERARSAPLVVVEQTRPQALDEVDEEAFNWVQHNVPGYTIIVVFWMAATTALSIYNEKKVGSFRRLLAAPISKATLLAGKMLPNFVVALVQIVVIFAASMLLLPLLGLERLTLGNDPLALVLVSLLLALCSTCLGILIIALLRTEGQIGTLAGLGVWIMGALGGCLVPLYVLGFAGLDAVSRVLPHYWALQAYRDLITRGRGLADVTTELLALLVFSAIFFTVGVWRFEFD
jgi:ABC-2 type transport system permease protein